MAERESLYLFSVTSASNGNADPSINFSEGQLPSTVNNSNRAVMAALARFLKDTNGALSTAGSSNAYTLTINGTQTAYASGQIYSFKANHTNTGAATLNVTNADATALGAKSIRTFTASGEAALPAGVIQSSGHYVTQYDAAANGAAGAFILLNPTLAGRLPQVVVYSATGTWTKADYPNMTGVIAEVVGAGGGSGGTASTGGAESAISGGGGGGGYSMKRIPVASLGSTESVTVGVGGTAGAAGNNAGGTGSTSSFGTHCQATGGSGGTGGGNAATGTPGSAAGGVGSGGDVNLRGGPSAAGAWNTSIALLLGTGGGMAARGAGGAAVGGPNAGNAGGGGASGRVSFVSASSGAGAAGGDGLVIVTVLFT